jgi:c-di-GMP-binding flagellar brake protein YcgR
MGDKRQIKGRDVLNDLRSGMADSELQIKYRLSIKALLSVFKQLMVCNAISHSELYEISSSYRDRVDHITRRSHPRADLAVHVPIYDIGSGALGVLRDISETGLRVAGIESRVGQARKFQIPIDMFMQAEPLLIMAECKWVELKERKQKYFVAGFEIIDLPANDRNTLQDFMSVLMLSQSGEWQTIG